MAINRTKVLDRAQKNVQQGKLAKAVEEYNLLLEDDPSDVRTLLKVGDLYARMGNIEAGLDTYKKVADHYSRDGFFLKAVAVYKQMLKLDPSAIPIYTQLAQLYNQLGLNNEALKQYQIVAKHYETKGMKKESLDIYKKMAELDPDNVASRVKLAELYAREGHEKQALDDFLRIADDLRNKGNNEDLVKIYEKIAKLDPSRIDIVRALAGLYLEIGEPKRALAKLQVCFKNDPKHEQTLNLLAKAFVDLQQPEKARAVYNELLTLYDEKGMRDKSQALRAKLAAEGSLESGRSSISIPAVTPPTLRPSSAPSVTAAPVALGASSAASSKDRSSGAAAPENETEKLLTDVEVYQRYGLGDKAIQALQKALGQNPDQPQIRQKLVDVYLNNNDVAGAATALLDIAAAARASGNNGVEMAILGEALAVDPENMKAMQLLQEMQGMSYAGGEAPEVSVSNLSMPEMPSAIPTAEVLEEAEIVDAIDDADGSVDLLPSATTYLIDDAGEAPLGLGGIEADMLRVADPNEEERAEKSQIHFIPPTAPVPHPAPIATSEEPSIEIEVEPFIDVEVPAPRPAPVEPKVVVPPPLAPKIPLKAAPQVSTDPHKDALEEAEFFVAQGLNAEALVIVDDILLQTPSHPGALRLATQIRPKPQIKTAAPVVAPIVPAVVPVAQRPGPKAVPKTVEAPRPPEVSFSREMERPLADLADSGDFFDLAAELKDEINTLNKPEAGKEDEPLSFDEVFAAFKKGVQKTVSEDETEAHYDLGIAYKEMGLLEDAISEFRIALKDIRLSVDSCSLIGLCYREMGRYNDAEASFKSAIDSLAPADERVLGLKYELAEVYAAAGKAKDALAAFKEVYTSNQAFRDVSHRMKELAEQMEGGVDESGVKQDAADNDPKKKSKISYL